MELYCTYKQKAVRKKQNLNFGAKGHKKRTYSYKIELYNRSTHCLAVSERRTSYETLSISFNYAPLVRFTLAHVDNTR